MFVEHAVPLMSPVVACQDSVRHLLPMPLGEAAQGSDDESLLADGQQGGTQWKLQVTGYRVLIHGTGASCIY